MGRKRTGYGDSDTATTLADMVGICYLRYFNNIGGLYIIQNGKKRVQLYNALHLRELEKAKADELNHTKLQFLRISLMNYLLL